jgi:hypothetical protein
VGNESSFRQVKNYNIVQPSDYLLKYDNSEFSYGLGNEDIPSKWL